jgi:hypothetical protein
MSALNSPVSPMLRKLNLNSNALGQAGTAAVADALRRGLLPALAELDLSHDRVWDTGARNIAEAVCKAHQPCRYWGWSTCPSQPGPRLSSEVQRLAMG